MLLGLALGSCEGHFAIGADVPVPTRKVRKICSFGWGLVFESSD